MGDRMVVAGGLGLHGLFDDVWQLDFSAMTDGAWSELVPTGTGPGPRAGAGAVWDEASGVLHFGGGLAYYDVPADRWELALSFGGSGAWSNVNPSGGPNGGW